MERFSKRIPTIQYEYSHYVDLAFKDNWAAQVSDYHLRGNFIGHLDHTSTWLIRKELYLDKKNALLCHSNSIDSMDHSPSIRNVTSF